MTKKPAPFKFKPFSRKQLQVLTWWNPSSPVHEKDGIICDGSVRAGKTIVMSLSYVMWAMEAFAEENLGMAGKTIGALRRNVVTPLKRMLKARGYAVRDHRADNLLTISFQGQVNYFYLFGGKDESSQDLIQGITLAGMFFDEVALMPQSFVSQAMARCSVAGSKLWFNCNPAGPYHWFKTEYIDKLDSKNLAHLHFTMDDNLSLSEAVKERYKRLYSGVFAKRYIDGLWVLAEGVVYDMFNTDVHVVHDLPEFQRYFIGVDYGTSNPTVFLLIGEHEDFPIKKYYVVKEYYFDSRKQGYQKTDAQYSKEFQEFCSGVQDSGKLIDPSAASFIAQLHRDGVKGIIEADNDVLPGIANVSNLLSSERLFISDQCTNVIREFGSYVWDTKAQERGEDKVVKQFDHSMDALRYVIRHVTAYAADYRHDAQVAGRKPYTRGLSHKVF